MVRRSSAVAGLTAVVALVAAGVASAHTMIRPQPRTSPFQSAFNDIVGSTNWAGYAVEATGRFTSVSGSWVEPAVTCTNSGGGGRGRGHGSGGSQQFASFWAGIDGYSSDSVEQLGTDSDCSGSTPSYYAWYEMYPAGSVTISTSSFPVRPGDTLSASVTVSGTTFTLSMSSSEGWHFSTTKQGSGLAQSSAELIAESPEVCSGFSCQLAQLSDFGTVNFSGASATAGGPAAPLGSFTADSGPHEIVGLTSSGGVKMQPSSLSPAGNAFSVAWEHN